MVDRDFVESVGFVPCEFPTKGEECDRCHKPADELFFGNTDYWDAREGDYLCELCIREQAAY